MENFIINHLFELWEYIGSQGNFLHNQNEYKYTSPGNFSWPSKVFEIHPTSLNFKELNHKIKTGELPNSISIAENPSVEKLLIKYNFEQQSVVKGMFLNLPKQTILEDTFPTIEQVDNEKKAMEFARIASGSFGYEVRATTITALLKNKERIKLFLGKHKNEFVHCGMIYLDKNGRSGIHMIGTLSKYRGFGLGKIMTNKLLLEAYQNLSTQVVLVASEAGERIYSKIGFIAQGTLKSFCKVKL